MGRQKIDNPLLTKTLYRDKMKLPNELNIQKSRGIFIFLGDKHIFFSHTYIIEFDKMQIPYM